MKWYEIPSNQAKLVRYLVRVQDFTAEQLLGVVERWDRWEKEFHEALRWHARQEAMSQRVFTTEVKPTDHNDTKTLFIAFRTDEDRPMVAANMLLWDCQSLGGWVVEWHEVASEHRRQGIATEFRQGIENYLGCELISDPGSDDGEKFLESLGVAK